MTKLLLNRTELLEHFYNHLAKEDWLSGLDLYQGEQIIKLIVHSQLVTAQIQAADMLKPYEVRFKIHPNGKVIQWMECSCKKNRTHGLYCEHIAAVLIKCDREQPKLFATLDLKRPINPPTLSAGGKKKLAQSKQQGAETNENASQSLLEHFNKKGSIQSFTLVHGGPQVRVKVTGSNKSSMDYELDLDNAARFLQLNEGSIPSDNDTLMVYRDKASLGTRIELQANEKILVERSIAIPVTKSLYSKLKGKIKLKHTWGKYGERSLVPKLEASSPEETYLFFPFKGMHRFLGKEFTFIPKLGYWPISTQCVKESWYELPLSKLYKEDEAAILRLDEYAKIASQGRIWLDPQLMDTGVISDLSISEIKIKKEELGWFYLDPLYSQDGDKVSMIKLLQESKFNKRKFFKSGKNWIKIPTFISEFNWQLDETGKMLKMDSLSLLRMKAYLGDFDQLVGSQALLKKVRTLTEWNHQTKVPSLEHTNLNLRTYQEEGVKWLWWLYENELHGLLADDMGLGKTHQAMALYSAIQKKLGYGDPTKPRPKFLIVCPTTVLDHWEEKTKEFAPKLLPLKYHGPRRLEILKKLNTEYDTLITSYGVLLRDVKMLQEIEWQGIILDEAHYVKNHQTATYLAACQLKSRIRLCLTGTPMENHLKELKSLFDFLVPGYLGSNEFFHKQFIQPIEARDDSKEEYLQKLIYPLKLRRNKNQVLADLPDKIEDVRFCTLSKDQATLYREILNLKAKPILSKLSEESGSSIPYLHVFAVLQLLKQVCDHPALVHKKSHYSEYESGKFELLKELLRSALESQHKVVIFSQYLEMIKIIKQYCVEEGIEAVTMTGQTRNRGEVIKKFQTDPTVQVFIGSLLAGGIGIDLTAASVVIHYDRWWNAAKENQATDRVHRFGQKKFVQVLKLVTRGTLEEKIHQLITKKANLFQKFLEKDEEIFKTLSREELIELLQ